MEMFQSIMEYLERNATTIVATLILVLFYFIGRGVLFRLVNLQARRNDMGLERVMYIRKLIHVMYLLLVLILLGAAWEISLKGLSIYFTSIFTILGVGLFANWSILSNMTSSIVLFFFFPYRIGHVVRFVDGDNSQEGRILDISLFYIRIETKGGLVVIPNNLAIQKVIVQLKSKEK